MKKYLLITLCCGLVVTSVSANEQMQGESPDSHEHKTVIISEDQPIPTIDLVVHQDTIKGWNLEVELNNFIFTPEMVNQENELNKGHAHLYINGEKVTRLYGNWYYLKELPVGKNEIRVIINTNQHEELIYQDNVIQDIEIIEVE
jgi:hypothetical protein